MNFRSLSIFKRLRKTSKFFVEWIRRIWNEIELKRMFLFNLKTSFRNFFVFFEFLTSNISIIKINSKNNKKNLFNITNNHSFLVSNNCYSIELNITLFCLCNFLFNYILFYNSFLLNFLTYSHKTTSMQWNTFHKSFNSFKLFLFILCDQILQDNFEYYNSVIR